MILADKILELRKREGWSQEELAEKLGTSRQSVSKWEGAMSIPDMDKIVKMSALFGVSTDYLLKDEITEPVPGQGDADDNLRRTVTLEEANAYTGKVEEGAKKFALGTSITVFCSVPLLILVGLAELGRIPETAAVAAGVSALLILVAVGVALMLLNGTDERRYGFLEEEEFDLDYGVRGAMEKKKEEIAPAKRKATVIGIILCILCAVPAVLAGLVEEGKYTPFAIALLLCLVSAAVYGFVWTGLIDGSCDKILQEGDYTPEEKRLSRKTGWIDGAYWMLAVAVYLGISFLGGNWERSWIVWAVAGVLFPVVRGIARAVSREK
jgi:transcriptional regulator with XRE-family HTH domain